MVTRSLGEEVVGEVVVVLAPGGVAGVGGDASAVPKDDLADGLAGAELKIMMT